MTFEKLEIRSSTESAFLAFAKYFIVFIFGVGFGYYWAFNAYGIGG